MIPVAIMLPVKPVRQDIIKMVLKNVLFVQVYSQTASNAMPKNASNAKIAPYLLELQENANPAIQTIITVPRAEQPPTVSLVSPISTSQVEFANYVARIFQDASRVKLHQQKSHALVV